MPLFLPIDIDWFILRQVTNTVFTFNYYNYLIVFLIFGLMGSPIVNNPINVKLF